MQYKTIVLELLEQRPEIYQQLRKNHKLLLAVEHYAQELKKNHEAWKIELSQARPGSDPQQVTSEAMEMAVQDLKDCLAFAFPPDENESLSLEAAMAFICRPMQPE